MAGYGHYRFCSPADIVEDPETGNFFVADGYCHSRVVKFDKNGKYLLEFGAGSSDLSIPPIPFNVTHALALAKRTSTNSTHGEIEQPQTILLVVDRDSARIQIFDLNGTFLYEIGASDLGSEHAMILSVATVTAKNFEFGQAFIIKGHVPVGEAKMVIVGLQAKNFTIISSHPIMKQKAPTPKLNVTSPKDVKLSMPHDIATKNGKEIYIVEAINDLTLQRYVWADAKSIAKQHVGKSSSVMTRCPKTLLTVINLIIMTIHTAIM